MDETWFQHVATVYLTAVLDMADYQFLEIEKSVCWAMRMMAMLERL